MRLWFDCETFSECDLKAHGTHRYAKHPSTEITVAQWAVDDGEPRVWDATYPNGSQIYNADVQELRRALDDPGVTVIAHNSHFDRTLLRHCWGIDVPIERWYDTMVQGLAHGLPGSLDKMGQVLGHAPDQAKDKRGRELIQLFCKPRPKGHKLRRATRETHPKEWAEFLEYSRQDIVAMRAVSRDLPNWNYKPGHPELALWHLDQKINDRGFQVDLALAQGAIEAVAREQARLKQEMQEATDNLVSSPSKRDALLAYILAEYGVTLPDMAADTLRRRLEDPELPEGVKLLISLRLEATKTSTAKYKALVNATSADGRLRNTLQFAGAQRTARWAGRIFQPQNLPRYLLVAIAQYFLFKDPNDPKDPHGTKFIKEEHVLAYLADGVEAITLGFAHLIFPDVMALSSNLVRSCIVAPPGRKLVVADLANIEGRGLAFLAGETWKLKAFAEFDNGTGADMYKLAYARSFNCSPDDVSKAQRQIGKVQELGLGYEGGVAAFITFAAVYNMDLDQMATAVWETASREALEAAQGMLNWTKKKGRSTFGLSDRTYIACEVLKAAWREAHPNTKALWAAAKEGVTLAIDNPGQSFKIGQHLIARRDGAWLRIRLPSGRYLCYLQPKVEHGGKCKTCDGKGVVLTGGFANDPQPARNVVCPECQGEGRTSGSGQISYMGVDQYTRQWKRVKTYGGKIVENCLAQGTLVLTEIGLRPIETVGHERVWDGVEWVSHGGLKYSGKQTTLQVFGVHMTPEHRVLTTEGWRRASSCKGLDRAYCGLPDGDAVCRKRWPEVALGSGMRVWPEGRPPWHGATEAEEARYSSLLRVYAGGHHLAKADHSRHVETSGVRGVAQHAGPVPVAVARCVGQLRRAWHRGVQAVGRLVRGLLGRHGPDVPGRADAGTRAERPGLQAVQLCVGNLEAAGEQHAGEPSRGDTGRHDDGNTSCAALRGEVHHTAVAPGARLDDGARPVYDLLNCGPRQRFVVVGDDGLPLIVHNCTQAFARDIMAYNMQFIEDSGYRIVLSVHDELITEAPDTPNYNADDLSARLARRPPWALGIPLAAAGFSCTRYRKE